MRTLCYSFILFFNGIRDFCVHVKYVMFMDFIRTMSVKEVIKELNECPPHKYAESYLPLPRRISLDLIAVPDANTKAEKKNPTHPKNKR